MCRPDASTTTSCCNAYSGNSHEQLPAGGLRTPPCRSNKHSKRHGHGRNPLGEPLRGAIGHAKIDQTCRYGSACRGRKSYCRYAHPVEKVAPGGWSVVVKKRRRYIRDVPPIVDDEVIIDDAIIDSLNDIVNHYDSHSAISATDAMHVESESGMFDMSQDLVPDNSELQSPTGSGFRCLTPESRDSACALDNSMDRDSLSDASDEDSDHAPRAMTRVNGCASLLPFGFHGHNQKITGHSISFRKDVERFQFEMEGLGGFTRNTKSYRAEIDNSHKIQKSTEQILENYSDIEVSRNQKIQKAVIRASKLADELQVPCIYTSFIIDTGAGLNLKCYAQGLSTREIDDLAMMSANGPTVTNKITQVKFRTIRNQNCVVLDNCPNVLSVGQLVAQGYDFLWIADPASKLQNHADRSSLASFDANAALASNPYEKCFLVTPGGTIIHLVVNNRVPYFNDCASEPDLELLVSELDDEVASDDCAPSLLPAAYRITKKSKVALTDHQQSLLDHAISAQLLRDNHSHDILHLYSHRNCDICREVKQRRNYSKPIPIERQNLVTKPFHKTDLDHIIMGKQTPGIHGETVGLVGRDEHLGWVSFSADKSKGNAAIAVGLRHHFGKELNKAQSRGFTIYSDSAPEYEKVCEKLRLLHRP